MTSYRVHSQTVDSKREEYRKYLENGGVLDVLTKVLTDIFEAEDRPEDVLKQIGIRCPDQAHIKYLKEEICVLKEKNCALNKENELLRAQLEEKK